MVEVDEEVSSGTRPASGADRVACGAFLDVLPAVVALEVCPCWASAIEGRISHWLWETPWWLTDFFPEAGGAQSIPRLISIEIAAIFAHKRIIDPESRLLLGHVHVQRSTGLVHGDFE